MPFYTFATFPTICGCRMGVDWVSNGRRMGVEWESNASHHASAHSAAKTKPRGVVEGADLWCAQCNRFTKHAFAYEVRNVRTGKMKVMIIVSNAFFSSLRTPAALTDKQFVRGVRDAGDVKDVASSGDVRGNMSSGCQTTRRKKNFEIQLLPLCALTL